MKLSEIEDEIEQDSNLDFNKLDHEALKIPMLYAKYYRYFTHEARVYKLIENDYNILRKDRIHYYLGKADDAVYKEEPLDFKVLKTELDPYLLADTKLNDLRTKMSTQKIKVDLLESFLKTLGNRSFLIRDAIEWRKFQAGQ